MSEQHPPPPPEEPGSGGPPQGPGSGAAPPPPEPSGTAPAPAAYGSAPPPAPYGSAPPPAPYGAAPPPVNPYDSPAPPVGAPEGGPVARPRSMDTAVLLMKVGAVVALLSALTVLIQGDSLRTAVEDALRDAGQDVTPEAVDLAVGVGTVAAIFSGLVGAGLWWWMAVVNGRGRSWARLVATVFFGLSTLNLLASFVQPQPLLGRVLGVVQWLVGLAVIVLIWRGESTAFYRSRSLPRA